MEIISAPPKGGAYDLQSISATLDKRVCGTRLTLLVPGLARHDIKAASLKPLQTGTRFAEAQACGKVSDELCDICDQFAVHAIDVLPDIIVGGECNRYQHI